MSTITTHSRNSSTSSLSHTTNKALPPPPSPIKHAPNPHPYAIKTTSSALTSHTTSSPAHAQAYKHYVPPSPTGVPQSPSRSRTSSLVGGENGGRHRYSRSMTEAGPKALPMTPDMERSGSASPSKSEFLELEGGSPRKSRFLQLQEDDEGFFGNGTAKSMRTPRQSGAMKRAETLPSSANASFVFPTPSSVRSNGRLRSDSQSSNSDADETNFASNSYRHSHTRSQEDPNSNKFASMRRSNGSRVRGMVESFERSASSSSGSELDGEGATRSRSSSPTKHSGAGFGGLPTRPRVVDLFSPNAPPTSASPERVSDSFDVTNTTLKPSSNRHSKELPRLLPYPPPLAASFFQPQQPLSHHTTGHHAPLEQMHTGAAYPLPMSPEHTGVTVVASEMGYRPTSRLLPIPPDLVPSPSPRMPSPEQVLHHPRPRKGGPPELVSVENLEGEEEELSMEELLAREGLTDEKIRNGKRNAKTGVHAWDVEAGDTVKRALPSGPRPVSSNRTKTPLKKLSSVARSISPKEDGSPVDADAEGDGHGALGSLSVSNGFVNGRRGRRARGLKPKARSSQDSLSEGGGGQKKKAYGDAGSQTDSDHEPSADDVKKSALETRSKELDARSEELDTRTAELSSLSVEIEETQRELEATQLALASRSAEIDGRALKLDQRAFDLEERAGGLERRRAELEKERVELEDRKAGLDAKDAGVSEAQATFDAQRVDVETRIEAVALREAVCLEREKALSERTVAVEGKERELEVRADAMRESLEESARDIEEMEKEVEEREQIVAKGRDEVERRERAFGDRERSVEGREGRVKVLEELLRAREAGIGEKEADLARREPLVAEKEKSVRARESELKAKESALKAATDTVKTKEAAVNARGAGLDAQETTLTLATRLFKRVAGPVFGERLVGYVFRPLAMSPEDYLAGSSTSEAAASEASSHSQASSSTSPSEPGPVASSSSALDLKQRPPQHQPKLTDIWAGIRPLFGRSPYFLVLGLGVCAIMLRVLAKGMSRGAVGGVVRGVAAVGGGVGKVRG